MEMKGGILEVLLASAQGIGHNIGKGNYYVILECGPQVYKSKTSRGYPKEICWNQKFTFELPMKDLEKYYHLKLRIMHDDIFTNGFVGKTIVNLKGIIAEGNESGFVEMKPVPHNVTLEDDSYKGLLNIGLIFTPQIIMQTREIGMVEEKRNGIKQFVYRKIIKLFQIQWWRRHHNS
ncbi:hypothetical protein DM860_004621 [Cuscuta australis]|uniref:C2 domain-containing protein n=1 Tax=Cuscuta australis TaxID=267555 RepID=A0A328E986_9ASTE|nr:hypothetical protein DM860_004621 [Cuscuta australis]